MRAADGSDVWTYYDRRSEQFVGDFEAVVDRCFAGPFLPYLLFYDALTEDTAYGPRVTADGHNTQ